MKQPKNNIVAKFYGIYCAVLLLLVSTACNLDETLYSAASRENYFVNAENAESGVLAIYKLQNKIYGNVDFGMPRFTFLTAPHASSKSAGFRIYSNYTFSPADMNLLRLWESPYRAINQSNTIISSLAKIGMNIEKRNALIAEAKFLRAYNYFNLVRLFGEIPYSNQETLGEEDAYAPFLSVAEIYTRLLEDLSEATMDALPDVRMDTEKGRVSRAAALTLKAKIMLTMAGKPLEDNSHLEEAAIILTELVDNSANYELELLDDYTSIFATDNKLNKEVIFAIQNEATVELGGTSISFTSSPSWSLTNTKGNGLYAVDGDWYANSFIDGDKRREVIVDSYYSYKHKKIVTWGTNPYVDGTTRGLFPWKHRDPACTTGNNGSTDFIIFRYADVLLMHAEVENERNGVTPVAIDAINQVLNRANANTLQLNQDPNGQAWTKESLREFIFQERMRELCFEFHEIFDIRRFGKVQWSIENSRDCIEGNVSYDPSMDYFPIPTSEMNARD